MSSEHAHEEYAHIDTVLAERNALKAAIEATREMQGLQLKAVEVATREGNAAVVKQLERINGMLAAVAERQNIHEQQHAVEKAFDDGEVKGRASVYINIGLGWKVLGAILGAAFVIIQIYLALDAGSKVTS